MAWTERYCRADAAGSGDGTTDTNSGANGAWTLAEAIANVTAGVRVNVRGSSGTFANGATARTFAVAGTGPAPIWWRGYNTTIGDLDADYTTAKPAITFGNALCSMTAAKNLFSNISWTGARTAGSAFSVSTEVYFKRCRFETTASGQPVLTSQTGAGGAFTDCYFKATLTAARVVLQSISTGFKKCVFDGAQIGLDAATSPNWINECVFINNATHGLNYQISSAVRVVGCSFKGCGGDGIHLVITPAVTGGLVSRCLFDSCVGWGVNNAGGTNAFLLFEDNDFYVGSGSGTITGFGDSPDFNEVTESSSPGVSSSDPTISATTFNGASMLRPFEAKTTWTGAYYDAGAVQRQVTSGGGGSPILGQRTVVQNIGTY